MGVHRVYGYPRDGREVLPDDLPFDPQKPGALSHGFRQKLVEYHEKLPGRDR
ncbi:MAG: hypothetical protein JO132_07310 [Streptosporangiaceae bacterium]|nr:hypothetical protein [Streptosporangiaceae bacterium]